MSKASFPTYDPTFKTGSKGNAEYVVVSPLAQLDWYNLFSMQQPDEQNELKEPEYNAQLNFPIDADFSIMGVELRNAAALGKKKWPADWPEDEHLKMPYKDQGKIKKQKAWHVPGARQLTVKAGLKTVERNGPPQLVDIQGNPLKDPSSLYRGAIVRAVLRAYPYNYKNKNFGVSYGLVGIQKIADADPYFERINAAAEFKPVQVPVANPGAATGNGAGSLFD
jgi:hypothetical protein